MEQRLTIGVLALQGAFREHVRMLRALEVDAIEVRLPEALEGLDAIVVPGGESTTMTKLARTFDLEAALREFKGPVFGTCAGMILVDRNHLGLADLEVERNAYGRQVASFEADVDLGDGQPFRGVFIRAPRVCDIGPGVEILGSLDGEPVLLRDGRVLVAAFHPELTDDPRIHELFIALVEEEKLVRA